MRTGVVSLLLVVVAMPLHAEKRIIPDFGEIEIISDPHDPMHFAHEVQVNHFIRSDGFGFSRRGPIRVPGIHGTWDRTWASWWHDDNERTSIVVVQLMGLLLEERSRVYLDERRLAPTLETEKEQLSNGEWRFFRRPRTFEAVALEQLVAGAQVVRWNNVGGRPQAVGAIRATQSCLECHSKAKEGDLLGAFIYYLGTEKMLPGDALQTARTRANLKKLLAENAPSAAFWTALGQEEPPIPGEFGSGDWTFPEQWAANREMLHSQLANLGIVSWNMLKAEHERRATISVKVDTSSTGSKPRLTYRGAYPRPPEPAARK